MASHGNHYAFVNGALWDSAPALSSLINQFGTMQKKNRMGSAGAVPK
jgi:hypothetical protein